VSHPKTATDFERKVQEGRLACGDCGFVPTADDLRRGLLNDPESDDAWCPKCRAHNFKETCLECGQAEDHPHGTVFDECEEEKPKPNEIARRNAALNAKPLWNNEMVQFPRLLAEIYAVIDPDDVERMVESMDLPVTQIRELFDRADRRWEGIKERHCPGEECECEMGNGCIVPGVLFPCSTFAGGDLATVERCDMCSRYEWDDEAAAELYKLIMDKGYTFAHYLIPGMKWEDAGSMHLTLMKVCEGAGGDQFLEPQTLEEGEALYRELLAEKNKRCAKCGSTSLDRDGDCLACGESREGYDEEPKAACCPECGGTKLDVQLPAVFRWDGEAFALGPENLNSDEFPVEDEAVVVCSTPLDDESCALCDWTGKVKDLVPKKP
jgi:rRNA maturation protein Nop10